MASDFAFSQLGIEKKKSALTLADEGVDQLRLLSLLFIYRQLIKESFNAVVTPNHNFCCCCCYFRNIILLLLWIII